MPFISLELTETLKTMYLLQIVECSDRGTLGDGRLIGLFAHLHTSGSRELTKGKTRRKFMLVTRSRLVRLIKI